MKRDIRVVVVSIVVVQLLNHVQLFATLWTVACQALSPPLCPGACSDSCPSSRRCHPYRTCPTNAKGHANNRIPDFRILMYAPGDLGIMVVWGNYI